MIILAVLLWISPALAAASPDIVHITVAESSISVDHPSQRDGDAIAVQIFCESGVDNPVVVTNQTENELFVTSPVGLARLSPASAIGTHTATFRSLPREVRSLAVDKPHATFAFHCFTD